MINLLTYLGDWGGAAIGKKMKCKIYTGVIRVFFLKGGQIEDNVYAVSQQMVN